MKIFGIGLSRTGTSSLHLALLTMGIPAIHYPRKMAQYWMRGIFNRKVQADYDAYTDIPTALYFRELHETHPKAKFILTTRDEDSWIESVRNYWDGKVGSNIEKTTARDLLRLAMYGCMNFDERRFREVYRRQHRLIDQYFVKYPNQLLKLDISEAESYQKLTDFLKLPQLDRGPYPHLKYPKLGDLTAVNRQTMTDHRSEILRKIQALTQPSN